MSKYPEVPHYSEDINFSDLNEAIATYVATRDALTEERKQYNDYEARSKAYMSRIEAFIQNKANEMGVDSVRTASGRAYRTVKEQFRISDWDAYWTWLRDNDMGHAVEKRAAKLAVKEVYDETGILPPGLEHHTEIVFDVRRPSK